MARSSFSTRRRRKVRNSLSPAQTLDGRLPFRFVARAKIERGRISGWCEARWAAPAHAATHMLADFRQRTVPSVKREPAPELRSIDHAAMPAIPTFGPEIHRVDAKVIQTGNAGAHAEQIRTGSADLKADFALSHLDRSNFAQGAFVVAGEDVG